MAEYEDMTKDELQAELEDRDLPVSGNKDELVARLELDDAEKEGAESRDPDEVPDPDEDGISAAESERRKAEKSARQTAPPTTQATPRGDRPASQEDVVASQAKDPSGQRDPEENPQPNAVAGQPEEDQEPVEDPNHFRNAGKVAEDDEGNPVRRRIDEDWDEPEPREMGRARTQRDPFDYELLPDGRKRKLIFEEGEDDDQE